MQTTINNPEPGTLNPEPATNSLSEALGLGAREHVAIVGGGGKSSLFILLSAELQRHGKRVLVSTTTRVREREASGVGKVRWLAGDPHWRAGLKEDLEGKGRVFLGHSLLDSEKVRGVEPQILDELYRNEQLDYLLVEADGSAGLPVKAPSEKEPVIPRTTTAVVALMGVEALLQPVGDSLVFRLEMFERVTGARPGERMTPLVLSRVFSHPEGLFKSTPKSARRVAFLNKADLAPDPEGVRELSGRILQGDVERVVFGSLKVGKYEVEKRR